MTKEILIALLQKDLAELQQLLEGMENWENIPLPIVTLAEAKANNILSSIHSLSVGDKENAPAPQEESMFVEEQSTEEHIVDQVVEFSADTKESDEVIEDSIADVTIETENKKSEVVDNETPQEVVEEPKVITLGESLNVEPSLNECLQQEDTSIGSVAGQQKVSDLASCMSLGDSFRFQRELFGGNGESMMQAIANINGLSNLNEALTYIERYHWDMDLDSVKDFVALLQRRFS